VIETTIHQIFDQTPAIDMHTHLFPTGFGHHALSGVNELLTYHYLEAEYFRLRELSPERYFALSKPSRADIIWDALFVRNTPLSEATSGVVTVFETLGLDTHQSTLHESRTYFQAQDPDAHLSNILRIANLDYIVMTNDPIDEFEASIWIKGHPIDLRFRSALRLDRIVEHADTRWSSPEDLRRFLEQWAARMDPLYMSISLPDLSPFFERSERARRLRGVIMPLCRDLGIPICLMLGVRRGVNPRIGVAADASCRAELAPLGDLCQMFPDNQILTTCLSLDNQHELCVLARKFANLTPFGCWWFVNNSSMVRTITEQRLEMLGTTFIAQHSDARVLEQLIYKWRNARNTVGTAYSKSAERLSRSGYDLSPESVTRDANLLFRGNFSSLCARALEFRAPHA
jgi:hypothetical protein